MPVGSVWSQRSICSLVWVTVSAQERAFLPTAECPSMWRAPRAYRPGRPFPLHWFNTYGRSKPSKLGSALPCFSRGVLPTGNRGCPPLFHAGSFLEGPDAYTILGSLFKKKKNIKIQMYNNKGSSQGLRKVKKGPWSFQMGSLKLKLHHFPGNSVPDYKFSQTGLMPTERLVNLFNSGPQLPAHLLPHSAILSSPQ